MNNLGNTAPANRLGLPVLPTTYAVRENIYPLLGVRVPPDA